MDNGPLGVGAAGVGSEPQANSEIEPPSATLMRGLAALAVTALILALAVLAASAAGSLFEWLAQMNAARSWTAGEHEAMTTARLALFLLSFQAASIVLTVVAAAFFSRGRERLLPLSPPTGGGFSVAASVAALIVFVGFYAVAVFVFDKAAITNDVLPFVEILRSRTWWLMLLAAAVGAPVAEEFLFRGFLYGVLRRSILGFAGAALVTAVVWASLHATYSGYGVAAIFLIGLYLAWVRERTGSLITPMICHGLYNGTVVAVLASAPDTVFKLG